MAVQKASSQRRMNPSMVEAMLVVSTKKPQNRVQPQKKRPAVLPDMIEASPILEASTSDGGLATRSSTPPAVIEAVLKSSHSVPRGRKPTDRRLGKPTPMKQAIIHASV